MWSIKWVALLAMAGALWASEGERRAILILGDSLAAGSGVDLDEAFPALLQKKIDEAGLKFEIINAGVSGDTSAGGLRRMDWLLRRKIDVLVLELGGNDGLRGIAPATTKTNLQTIIDRTKAKYPQVKVVVAGMQMPPNMGEEYNTAFRQVFPEVAKANKAALVPFLLEGVGGKAQFNLPDQIHPNPDGHKIVAENVWKVLNPVIRSDASARL